MSNTDTDTNSNGSNNDADDNNKRQHPDRIKPSMNRLLVVKISPFPSLPLL